MGSAVYAGLDGDAANVWTCVLHRSPLPTWMRIPFSLRRWADATLSSTYNLLDSRSRSSHLHHCHPHVDTACRCFALLLEQRQGLLPSRLTTPPLPLSPHALDTHTVVPPLVSGEVTLTLSTCYLQETSGNRLASFLLRTWRTMPVMNGMCLTR